MHISLQKLIASYKPSVETIELVRSTPIVVLVGVSGAGKDSLKQRLMETGEFHHIVSHTTRAPRENGGVMEQDGVEYHFISPAQAENMLKNGEFVEAKQYGENVYGTSAAEVQWAKDAQKIALTDIEVQGVAEYKAISDNVIALFILPPSYQEWQRRLHARYGTAGADKADIQRRMATAIAELEEALSKPYYHFIVNDNLDEAVAAADTIAHEGSQLGRVDRSFHVWAETLLKELKQSS